MDGELTTTTALCTSAVLLEMLMVRGELPPWAMASAQEVIATYLREFPGAMARREREAWDEHMREHV